MNRSRQSDRLCGKMLNCIDRSYCEERVFTDLVSKSGAPKFPYIIKPDVLNASRAIRN